MKVIVKRPGESSHVEEVLNELHVLQDIVKGHIEPVRMFEDFALLVNEEGLINGLPFNCRFLGLPIFGTVIGIGIDGEDFCNCPLGIDTWRGCLK